MDAAEEKLVLGTGNGNSCPREHPPSLWAVRENTRQNCSSLTANSKINTEIPNKVLITEPFRLEKISEIESNH